MYTSPITQKIAALKARVPRLSGGTSNGKRGMARIRRAHGSSGSRKTRVPAMASEGNVRTTIQYPDARA